MKLKFPLSLIAIASLIMLSGCASENPAGDGSLPSIEGSFDGVYYNTSGSPGSGGDSLTIDASGVATLLRNGVTYTGRVSAYQLSVTSSTGTNISGTIAKTGKYWTLTYSESDGTKGTNPLGMIPTASPLAGAFSGTFQAGTIVGNVLTNISAAGAVGEAFSPPSGAYAAPGFVDDQNDLFIHYYNTTIAAYQIAVGLLTINGSHLTGTIQEFPSGDTVTLDETAH